MAFDLILPLDLFVYFPIRGPTISAPTKAAIPPTEWITAEPAKSTKCNCCNQPCPPRFHTHPASIGYTIRLIAPE